MNLKEPFFIFSSSINQTILLVCLFTLPVSNRDYVLPRTLLLNPKMVPKNRKPVTAMKISGYFSKWLSLNRSA